ncbi:PucR family transcriptional regulator [Nonomuraea sp. NPDC049480]|uniref:PucR family transcriptional regulator n=1 Tax=Nonomuraea sp. NPDC049480 TaxID=3364353 RepID=UPI00379800E7
MLEQPGNDSVVLSLPAVLLGIADTALGPRPPAAGPGAEHRTGLLRLLDLLGADGRSLGYRPALALVNDRVYALLPAASGGVVPLAAFIAHLRDRAARALHVNVSMVCSGRVGTLAELRGARRDVDSALDHLRAEDAAPGTYTTDDLRAELVRQRLLEAVRADPLLRWGDRVRDHDREHRTEFRGTLLAYLRHFGDVNAARAELTIHQNTMRQRLRRAQELFRLSLDNPAQRLMLEIELAAPPPG